MKIRLARVWALSLLSIVLGFALTGAAGAGEVSLRFNDAEHKEIREALDVFQKQNPSVKVVLQRIAWSDAREQFLREAAVGQGPDIGHFGQVMIRSMGAGRRLPEAERPGEEARPGRALEDGLPLHGPRQPGRRHHPRHPVDRGHVRDGLQQGSPPAGGDHEVPGDLGGAPQASRQIKQKTGKTGLGFPAGSGSTNSIWFFCNFYWWSHGWALVDRTPDGKYVMGITQDQIAEAFDYYNSYFKEGHNDKALLAVTNWGAQELIEGMV